MIFNLNFSFGPRWECISTIRNFINDILSIGVTSKGKAEDITTANSELMENLIKYSAVGVALISIHKDSDMGKITLNISNIATQENIDMFKTIYEEVIDGPSKEAYKKRMIKSITNPGKSQLGLARIRFECGGNITYQISEDLGSILEPLGIKKKFDNHKLIKIKVEISAKLSHIN